MAAIVPTVFAVGAGVASAELAIVAFCGTHGARSITGLVLGSIAVGSCSAGLVYGAIRWRSDVLRQFQRQALLLAVLSLGLLIATDVTSLAVGAFALGIGITPILITAFGLIQDAVPARVLTEGMAWVSAGVNLGAGLGVAVVGESVDRHGPRAGFFVAIACTACGAVFALTTRRSVRRERTPTPAPREAARSPRC
jgi:MFS family permease